SSFVLNEHYLMEMGLSFAFKTFSFLTNMSLGLRN
ncbi:hypothetical protein NT05LM_1264, partial [Listeria marthii FSL S4-120]